MIYIYIYICSFDPAAAMSSAGKKAALAQVDDDEEEEEEEDVDDELGDLDEEDDFVKTREVPLYVQYPSIYLNLSI